MDPGSGAHGERDRVARGPGRGSEVPTVDAGEVQVMTGGAGDIQFSREHRIPEEEPSELQLGRWVLRPGRTPTPDP